MTPVWLKVWDDCINNLLFRNNFSGKVVSEDMYNDINRNVQFIVDDNTRDVFETIIDIVDEIVE